MALQGGVETPVLSLGDRSEVDSGSTYLSTEESAGLQGEVLVRIKTLIPSKFMDTQEVRPAGSEEGEGAGAGVGPGGVGRGGSHPQ